MVHCHSETVENHSPEIIVLRFPEGKRYLDYTHFVKEISQGPSNEMLIFSVKVELPVKGVSIGPSLGIVSFRDSREKITLLKSITIIQQNWA